MILRVFPRISTYFRSIIREGWSLPKVSEQDGMLMMNIDGEKYLVDATDEALGLRMHIDCAQASLTAIIPKKQVPPPVLVFNLFMKLLRDGF